MKRTSTSLHFLIHFLGLSCHWIPLTTGISYQYKLLELFLFYLELCFFVGYMNVGLKRTGSLKIMFSKPSPPSWKGNECQDQLHRIINLISRKRSWVRTLGQEAAIYCDWWGKAECQRLIARQEAIIHWQQFPWWLCLFYNKLLKQWESSMLGSNGLPLTGAVSCFRVLRLHGASLCRLWSLSEMENR